jgi:hypothetical protein
MNKSRNIFSFCWSVVQYVNNKQRGTRIANITIYQLQIWIIRSLFSAAQTKTDVENAFFGRQTWLLNYSIWRTCTNLLLIIKKRFNLSDLGNVRLSEVGTLDSLKIKAIALNWWAPLVYKRNNSQDSNNIFWWFTWSW